MRAACCLVELLTADAKAPWPWQSSDTPLNLQYVGRIGMEVKAVAGYRDDLASGKYLVEGWRFGNKLKWQPDGADQHWETIPVIEAAVDAPKWKGEPLCSGLRVTTARGSGTLWWAATSGIIVSKAVTSAQVWTRSAGNVAGCQTNFSALTFARGLRQ